MYDSKRESENFRLCLLFKIKPLEKKLQPKDSQSSCSLLSDRLPLATGRLKLFPRLKQVSRAGRAVTAKENTYDRVQHDGKSKTRKELPKDKKKDGRKAKKGASVREVVGLGRSRRKIAPPWTAILIKCNFDFLVTAIMFLP